MREYIPDASRQVPEHGEVTWSEELGRITVVRRRWGPVRRLIARVIRLSPQRLVKLDPLGSAAWKLVDGRRTVSEIRVELGRVFPQEPDIPLRLGKFLSTMLSERMLRLR